MNVEAPDHTIPASSEDQARPVRKVLRPLNTGEAIQKNQLNEQNEGSIVFFRLKRTAEYELSDMLAIDDMNVPLLSKKHQAKHIRDLEDDINKLNINENKGFNEEVKENENSERVKLQEGTKEILEGLLFSEDSLMDMKFVLKRVDPRNIYDSEKNEEQFRKDYKTMYNDINTKQKRDNLLNQRRKNLLENPKEEDEEKKKDTKKIKIYDINLKEEFKQNVVFCNNSPMVVTNLLEMASKKNDFEEETDDNYAYYAFRKVPKKIAAGARAVMLHESTKGIISSHHLAEEEDQQFVHEGQDKDSDYEYKNDVDNHDSNAEDNSENEYPDEEEVEGSHSRDPWSDSDQYRNNNNYDEEDEDDYQNNNEDDEEEEDEDIMFKDKKYHEDKFKNNFWSKIKDMSKEDAE